MGLGVFGLSLESDESPKEKLGLSAGLPEVVGSNIVLSRGSVDK